MASGSGASRASRRLEAFAPCPHLVAVVLVPLEPSITYAQLNACTPGYRSARSASLACVHLLSLPQKRRREIFQIRVRRRRARVQ